MSGTREGAARSDEEVVRAVLGGDEGAYRELVDRYKRRALGVAVGIVGDPDDALDVVQDAFVKAFYNLREFRFGSNFYTWFYRLLVNQAIDRWRKGSRSQTVPFDESWMTGEISPPEGFVSPRSPEDLVQDREIGAALSKAISSLPGYHREVIVLREIEGMPYDEIAKVLGCSVGTVMSRLHYARAKLREALKDFREE